MHPQVKFYVYGQELIIPLASTDETEDSGDDGYTTEVVRRILAAKDQGLVSDKGKLFHSTAPLYDRLLLTIITFRPLLNRNIARIFQNGGGPTVPK